MYITKKRNIIVFQFLQGKILFTLKNFLSESICLFFQCHFKLRMNKRKQMKIRNKCVCERINGYVTTTFLLIIDIDF
jgi:hypothetical protein